LLSRKNTVQLFQVLTHELHNALEHERGAEQVHHQRQKYRAKNNKLYYDN
jgi:nitrogen-specific signal transduction histidine kinase